jgi:hypothetical protein
VREVGVDGGFNVGPTNAVLEDFQPESVLIAGRQEPGSRTHATPALTLPSRGAEGRVSHLNAATGWTDPGSRATS